MPRKSDEPEYTIPGALVPLVRAWETICPGITYAVHEEIATGDWDRQESGFVPSYETTQAFTVALEVLERSILAQHVRDQLRTGPWYVRWGMGKASTVLPPSSLEFLHNARQAAINAIASLPVECRDPLATQALSPSIPLWNNPQVSMTWHNGVSAQQGTAGQ